MMTVRRSHYEIAFEKYMNRRGTPLVSVDDARHVVKQPLGAKAFDYVVYPPGKTVYLVDVKGRKTTRPPARGECRDKNWVTVQDVEGLLTWEQVFGPGHVAMFAFGYWLAGLVGPALAAPGTAEVDLAGRVYRFWLVEARVYAAHQRPLSLRWKTVSVPRETFRSICRPLDAVWPPAPC